MARLQLYCDSYELELQYNSMAEELPSLPILSRRQLVFEGALPLVEVMKSTPWTDHRLSRLSVEVVDVEVHIPSHEEAVSRRDHLRQPLRPRFSKLRNQDCGISLEEPIFLPHTAKRLVFPVKVENCYSCTFTAFLHAVSRRRVHIA